MPKPRRAPIRRPPAAEHSSQGWHAAVRGLKYPDRSVIIVLDLTCGCGCGQQAEVTMSPDEALGVAMDIRDVVPMTLADANGEGRA